MDTIGSFWHAARPDKRVPGRLTFDPSEGGRLELYGAFRDPEEVIAKARTQQEGQVSVGLSGLLGLNSPPIRILGDTADGPVTLDRCLEVQSTLVHRSGPQLMTVAYHVPLVFRGTHFLNNGPLRFEAAQFDILHLAHWIGKSSLDVSVTCQKDSNRVEQIHIFNTPVGDTIVNTPCGQLSLAFEYQLSGDRIVEAAIKQNCTLELRFADLGSIDKVFETHDALQALIAIGGAAPARVTEARVPTAAGCWVQVLGGSLGIKNDRGEVRAIRPFDMLFTYDGLGGLSGIDRWLAMSKKFRPVIGMLMSRWYEPDLYGELQFFSMVTAAEAFERIRLQEQNINCKNALEALASRAGAPFRSVVDDVRPWAKRVVRIRSEHVVHRGLHDDHNGESLYWLTASLYILVVLCLLRECEVPEENLPNPQRCPWMATVARKLREDQQ